MSDSSPLFDMRTHTDDGSSDSMRPAERRRLRQRFEQASRMMEQSGYDALRVHEALAECVAQEPGNAAFVAGLLRNLRQVSASQCADRPIGQADPREELTQAAQRRDWATVFRLGPAALLASPYDAPTLGRLALASRACGYLESASLYVGRAVDSASGDPEIHRQAARILSDLGQIDEALWHWHQVEQVDPRDDEAPRMIAALTLERLRRPAPEEASEDDASNLPETNASDTGVAKPVGSAAKPPVSESPERRTPEKPKTLVLTHRQQLEKAIVDSPEDEMLYAKLADLHMAEDRLFEAQKTLSRALNITSELHVREKLEDVNILRARQQAQAARQRAAEERTVEAAELAEKLENDLQQLEFDTVRIRCDRYPEDKSLRFQLGLWWKKRGDLRQALQPLQAGLEVPEHRAAASLEIGEILQRYKQLPKALQCYRQSAQLASQEPHDEGILRTALYRAGVLAAQMKLHDSARHYFSALVETDPGYKDARARLDKLNEIDETV